MSRHGSAPATEGRALVIALSVGAVLACASGSPLAAQAVAGLDKGAAKRAMSELDVALARLHDGWHQATLAVGEDAEPEVVVEAIVRMIHDPIKLVGLGTPGALEHEENLALKAAMARAVERVRGAPAVVREPEGDAAAVRAETQRALDDYLAVLGPWIAGRPKPPAGAGRP